MLKTLITLIMVVSSSVLIANPFSISVRTGMIVPDDNLDEGIITGLTVGYKVTPVLEAQFSIDYHRQNSEYPRKIIQTRSPYERRKEMSDITATLIPISLNIQYNHPLTARISPIIGGGIGMSFLDESVTPKDSQYQEGYGTFRSYSGLNSIIWTGFKYHYNLNINLLSKVYYRYSDLSGSLDLRPHGHIDEKQDISGLGLNIGVEYSF